MHIRLINRIAIIFSLIAVVGACAKISSPSGGPVDKTPPVVIKSTPLNGAKNFKGNKIEIDFNEYVVLDNINDKFMVSPPMKKKPRVVIRGKGVVVELDEKLKDSTTYTFYFQDAIKDLNAGNVLPNFQFVLSTGPVIDSLSVTGNLYNSDNLEVPEKTELIMYRELADSAVKKHIPEYISRLDPTGYFRIDNVRPGIYRLYGLKDADNSKNYNLPDESFAFMDSTVVITAEKNQPPPVPVDTTPVKKEKTKVTTKKGTTAARDTTSQKKVVKEVPAKKGEYRLFLFTALKKAHYLMSSKRENKFQLFYVLSLPPDTMNYELTIPDADKKQYLVEPSRNRDTIKVWLTDSLIYSKSQLNTLFKYPFTDSLGITGYKQDTIMMRFLQPKPSKNSKVKRVVFTPEYNIIGGFLKPGQTIVFKSKTPFREPDTTKIRLFETAESGKKSIPYQFVKDSLISTRYYFKANISQGKKYMFLAEKSAFKNIYNDFSDSIGIKFSIKDPDSYCKLTLNIKNYVGGRIIQLLDKTEKLIAETYMPKDGKTVFQLLDAGVYRLKVIYDLNGDKKWTTGDFDTGRQPEPVSYYKDEIELRTGFYIEQDWDIGIKNFKESKLLEKKKTK